MPRALLQPVPLDEHLTACAVAEPGDAVIGAIARVLAKPVAGARLGIGALPTPLPTCAAFPEGRLSPRLMALYARVAPLCADDRVLLIGDPMVAVAAVLHQLPPARRPGAVTLLTCDPSRARWTADRLGLGTSEATLDIVPADDDYIARSGHTWPTFDHVLSHQTPWSLDDAAALVGDDGTATVAHAEGRDGGMWQHVRASGDGADIDLSEHQLHTPPGDAARPLRRARRPTRRTVPVGRLIAAEPMLLNAWRGIATTAVEQSVLRAVRGTFGNEQGPEGAGVGARRLAERLFHLGYLEQVVGMRHGAEALYRASLATEETAEAWTFLGWVRSQGGHTEEAVDACRRAIELDPTFGNPYNDIGAYLLADGDPEGAKNWFHRATRAPRYAAPHYPYTNLGRVFLREGDLHAARDAIEQALEMVPGYPPAERLMREIEAREAHDPLGL